MLDYLTLNLTYAGIVFILSLLYYKYETNKVYIGFNQFEEGKYKRRLSADNFEKYLLTDLEINQDLLSSEEDDEENEKKRVIPKAKVSDKISFGVQDILTQIRVECSNFLISEFKLVVLYSSILTIFFYFAGKNEIALYFCISFLLGVSISLICAYSIIKISTSNVEILINKAK